MAYHTILVETRGAVGLITLNRPDALNALNTELIDELSTALDDMAADDKTGCVVLTGSAKAFAAGADIKEMEGLSFIDVHRRNYPTNFDSLLGLRKPVIAAVAGYALGGGCELAMMCDFIIAADTARFGQPEITLGVIPGLGGTQRLTRLVGKSKAMDMCLTGRMMEAEEAERAGLVSRVVPADQLIEEAMKIAAKVAGFSAPSVAIAKEAVARAEETTLTEGILFERRVFQSLFATEDRKEGMAAFVAKRAPRFKNR